VAASERSVWLGGRESAERADFSRALIMDKRHETPQELAGAAGAAGLATPGLGMMATQPSLNMAPGMSAMQQMALLQGMGGMPSMPSMQQTLQQQMALAGMQLPSMTTGAFPNASSYAGLNGVQALCSQQNDMQLQQLLSQQITQSQQMIQQVMGVQQPAASLLAGQGALAAAPNSAATDARAQLSPSIGAGHSPWPAAVGGVGPSDIPSSTPPSNSQPPSGSSASGASHTRPPPPGLDPDKGDWQCGTCGNWNWARRNACNKCQSPWEASNEASTTLSATRDAGKEEAAKSLRRKQLLAQAAPSDGSVVPVYCGNMAKPTHYQMKSHLPGPAVPPTIDPSVGDWQCTCGNWNWAKRTECNMCKAAKPLAGQKRTGAAGGFIEFDQTEGERRKVRALEAQEAVRARKAEKKKCDVCHRFSCIC